MEPQSCQHQWTRSTRKDEQSGNMVVTDTCALCGEKVSMESAPYDLTKNEVPPPQQPAVAVVQPAVAAPPKEPPPPKGSIVVKAGGAIQALVPTTMQEAWLFCSKMAASFNLPKAFYEMPKLPEGMDRSMINIMDVATARAMHALQLGMEVGLPPAQAIQSILVQNGVGTIWGDAQLALVVDSGKAEYVREYTEGGDMWLDDKKTSPNPAYTWVCETKRRGSAEPVYGRFSIADAVRAELWGKRGKSYDGNPGKASTWVTHPDRMGKYKARAFALRDTYPDVLKGLTHSREEFEGEVLDVTPERAPATDITPQNGAQKLAGLLDKTMLEGTQTVKEGVSHESTANLNNV